MTPAYPGFEVEVEALRADPTPIEQLEVPEIIDMLENMIGKLDRPPIIMGHSAGGAFTQILLDHGFGAAGVVINSAPTEGVKVVPLSQVRSGFPVLKNPANRHRAVGFTPEQWHYVFANTFNEQESLALYERYHIPASGKSSGEAHSRTSTLARTTPTSTTTTTLAAAASVHLREAGSPLPSEGRPFEREALQVEAVTEIVEFDGPHLSARDPGMGGRRGLRARLGVEARDTDTSYVNSYERSISPAATPSSVRPVSRIGPSDVVHVRVISLVVESRQDGEQGGRRAMREPLIPVGDIPATGAVSADLLGREVLVTTVNRQAEGVYQRLPTPWGAARPAR